MNIELRPYETFASFRTSGIMLYQTPIYKRNSLLSSSKFISNASKLAKRDRYVGFVTDGIKKRMKKCITLLLQSTPNTWKQHPITGKMVQHSISFITLTTPDHDLSRDAKWTHKNLLEPMLRILRRRFGMKSYIWKCELQANGQIHYHITCDVFTNHSNIKNEWNAILRRNSLLIDFKKKYGHDNPNSTDIHAVNKVKNLEAYLVKYICKEYQNEDRLSGKIWDASKNLKKSDYFKVHVESRINDFISELKNSFMSKIYVFEKATFIDFMTPDYYSYFTANIIYDFNHFLNNVYNSVQQPWQQLKSSIHSPKLSLTLNSSSERLKHVGVQCTLGLQTHGLI